MEIILAKTQGFCSGVANAVKIVDSSLKKYGPPIYVYHEIVHNTHVVEDFKRRGVIFVEDIVEVPTGGRLIFSAHGIPPQVLEKAKSRGLQWTDATCPLVKRVHQEAERFSQKGYEIILIGHKGHQEMIGTAGYIATHLLHIVENPKDINLLKIAPSRPVAYLTQTTLSVDETRDIIARIKERFPNVIEPSRSDICFATQKRQDAVKELAKKVDVILVCGSASSSNSNRLRETGEQQGVPSYIIDSADELNQEWLKGCGRIGISSGASVPQYVVEGLIGRVQDFFAGITGAKMTGSKRHEGNNDLERI